MGPCGQLSRVARSQHAGSGREQLSAQSLSSGLHQTSHQQAASVSLRSAPAEEDLGTPWRHRGTRRRRAPGLSRPEGNYLLMSSFASSRFTRFSICDLNWVGAPSAASLISFTALSKSPFAQASRALSLWTSQ